MSQNEKNVLKRTIIEKSNNIYGSDKRYYFIRQCKEETV